MVKYKKQIVSYLGTLSLLTPNNLKKCEIQAKGVDKV